MADFSTQTKLFSLNGIDNLRDPVRNTRWRVLIPSEIFAATGIQVTNGGQFNNGQDGTDEFALHVKTCKIPELKNEAKDHWYMGFKQKHVVNTDMSAELDFQTILLEDMRAYEAMIAWEQACHNTGILVDRKSTRNSSHITNSYAVFGLKKKKKKKKKQEKKKKKQKKKKKKKGGQQR